MIKFNSILFKNTIIYGISVLVERLISFLIIPIITKNLPPEIYALWTQTIITSGILSMITSLGFPTSMIKFLGGKKDIKHISETFYFMLTMSTISCFILIFILYVFNYSLSILIFGDVIYSSYVNLLGLIVLSENFFELLMAFFRSQNKIIIISCSYFLKYLIRFIFLAIGLFLLKFDLYQTILLILSFQFIYPFLVYIRVLSKKIYPSLSFSSISFREILSYSLYLVPYGLIIWANSFIDRYIILYFLDMKHLGIYAVAYSFATIPSIFYSILGYTLYPHIAKKFNSGEISETSSIINKSIKYYIFSILPIISVLTIFNKEIIKFFSSSQYISSWEVILFLSLGIGIFGIYQINSFGLILTNKIFTNLIISVGALIINLLLNVILIPLLNIQGAAVATFFSNIFLALLCVFVNKKFLSFNFPLRETVRITFDVIVISFLTLIIKKNIEINNITVISLIGVLISLYIILDLIRKDSISKEIWEKI